MMNAGAGGIESFLRTAGGAAAQGLGVGEGLAQMFGGQLPEGVDPKEMEKMWAYLDNMASTNPTEYKKFIEEQMGEMKQEISKEKEEEKKAQTIQSEPAFCVKCLVAKKILAKDRKSKEQKAAEGIKLFDFNSSQIKESFVENLEKNYPLEEPILYLNVVYHDKVLQPLNKDRDIADEKNDREWMIIPMVFTEGKSRKNLEDYECIHYDVHINSCVVAKMKEENRAMRSISNFIILKFQEYLEDQFVIHKKTIKFLKKRRYKHASGKDIQKVQPFVLPKEHDHKSFLQVKEKLMKEQKEKEKQQLAPKKEDIKLLPSVVQRNMESQKESVMPDIKIPGQHLPGSAAAAVQKKGPVIMEMSKTIPNFDLQDSGETFTMTFNVEEEESAKDIELDISESELKLNSKNYEFKYSFKAKVGYLVDPEKVKAKFTKGKRTLALTFTKKSE